MTTTRPSAIALETIGPLLVEAEGAARAAWPSFGLAPELFWHYLRDRLPREHTTLIVRRWHTADLYLACACAQKLVPAIDVFEREYLSVVDVALASMRADADVVAEVKQRIRHRVLAGDLEPERPARILEYEGRGCLRGWLRVMAVREAIHMAQRARRDLSLGDDILERAISAQTTPDVEAQKVAFRGEFKRAFAAAMASLPDRDRIFLRQHFIDGLTVDDLGRIHRMHRSTAARRLKQAELTLLARTRSEFRARIDVPMDELDSILRLIRSRLEISLGALRIRRRG